MKNVLILSCGTRNKVIRYFKKAFEGKGLVLATDCSAAAPALYEADKHFIVPRITAPGYLDVILEICRKEQVSGVLSLIDPELSLLAKHREAFEAVGTTVIGSGYEECERCMDKYEMYRWLTAHGYRTAKSFMDEEAFERAVRSGEIRYPVFVKPARGSASIAVSKAEDLDTVRFLRAHTEGMMIQEYMRGQEIGADVYIDLISGEVTSIFSKKKLVMRAGETDKAVSFRDERLFELIERFAAESGFRGQVDIDLFESEGEYFISEVNPRFGGGYPHAYECGCDHMTLIYNNLCGRANEKRIGGYEEDMLMMKYNDLMIRKAGQ